MKLVQTVDSTNAFANTRLDATAEISKVSACFLSLSAGIIGCWAAASLITGTVTSGGIGNLVQNFVSAVTG
jgi:hypothetical protein